MSVESETVVESTSVELEPSTAGRSLFRTDDPVQVLDAAKRVAGALKAEIAAAGMVQKIAGREFVKVEGWQTLAAMLGATTTIAWSRPLADGWEARAEVRTADGRLIGAGEAMCLRAERSWARRDEYAIRSMAQTRAMSKALRVPLAFVMTLAGHEPTPAEEVDAATAPAESARPSWARPAADVQEIAADLVDVLQAAGVPRPAQQVIPAIGQRIRDVCDETIPMCVAVVVHELRAAIENARPASRRDGRDRLGRARYGRVRPRGARRRAAERGGGQGDRGRRAPDHAGMRGGRGAAVPLRPCWLFEPGHCGKCGHDLAVGSR